MIRLTPAGPSRGEEVTVTRFSFSSGRRPIISGDLPIIEIAFFLTGSTRGSTTIHGDVCPVFSAATYLVVTQQWQSGFVAGPPSSNGPIAGGDIYHFVLFRARFATFRAGVDSGAVVENLARKWSHFHLNRFKRLCCNVLQEGFGSSKELPRHTQGLEESLWAALCARCGLSWIESWKYLIICFSSTC